MQESYTIATIVGVITVIRDTGDDAGKKEKLEHLAEKNVAFNRVLVFIYVYLSSMLYLCSSKYKYYKVFFPL